MGDVAQLKKAQAKKKSVIIHAPTATAVVRVGK